MSHLTEKVPHPLQTVFILFFFIDANVVKEPLVGIREDCTRTAMGSEHEGSM
jgi:hypothetical protein